MHQVIGPAGLGLAAGIGFVAIFSLIPIESQDIAIVQGSLTKNQENAVRIAFADDAVKQLIRGKSVQIGTVQIGNVYHSSCENWCAIMTVIQSEDKNKSITILVDTLFERVVYARPSESWQAES